jgi:hypothetical protein
MGAAVVSVGPGQAVHQNRHLLVNHTALFIS